MCYFSERQKPVISFYKSIYDFLCPSFLCCGKRESLIFCLFIPLIPFTPELNHSIEGVFPPLLKDVKNIIGIYYKVIRKFKNTCQCMSVIWKGRLRFDFLQEENKKGGGLQMFYSDWLPLRLNILNKGQMFLGNLVLPEFCTQVLKRGTFKHALTTEGVSAARFLCGNVRVSYFVPKWGKGFGKKIVLWNLGL